MLFFCVYLILGAIAYLWLFRKRRKDVMPACLFLVDDEVGLILGALLWPIIVPFCFLDNSIQEKEIVERENRVAPVKIDLSKLKGKQGRTICPHSPTGRVRIEGHDYESRSIHAFISEDQIVKVVGHSMNYLEIELGPKAQGFSSNQ